MQEAQETVSSGPIHIQYAGYELPEEVVKMRRAGIKLFNSKHIEKLIGFLSELSLNFNTIYDQYLHDFPAYRLDTESREEFRSRSSFQKLLYKAKPMLYDYSVYLPKAK